MKNKEILLSSKKSNYQEEESAMDLFLDIIDDNFAVEKKKLQEKEKEKRGRKKSCQ